MIKKILFVLVFIGIVIILILYFNSKNSYSKKFYKLDNLRTSLYFDYFFDDYFFEHFSYPSNVDTIDQYFKILANSNEKYYDDFIDPLSNSNQHIKYIPLYNRINKRIEAYVLLSAGIDGKINNVINNKDTFFIDNYQEIIASYNRDSFYKTGDTIKNNKAEFNFINYLFGKKDYIIFYMNGIEGYEIAPISSFQPFDSTLNRILEYKNLQTRVIRFISTLKMDTNNFILNVNDSNSFIGKLDHFIEIKNNIQYKIIGCIDSIDTLNRIAYLRNCLVSEFNKNK